MTAALKPKRALLIANPDSRGGGSIAPAIERLEASGIELLRAACSSADDVSPTIRHRRGEVDSVIIAGGDGTLNAAAGALVETGLPLGILPTGTANDLARTLGIPADLTRAASIIAAGHRRRIDLGDVNGRSFFNVASIGLSADLARQLTREMKRRFGRLAYALASMRILLKARPFRATIVGPAGAVRVRTLQITVGNGRYYSGGMTVERSARIDDRHLDLYSLELKRVWKLAFMLPWFRNGAHGAWSEVRTARGTAFEVRTRRSLPVNVDGEIVTTTPARFTMLPRAVAVFAPPLLTG